MKSMVMHAPLMGYGLMARLTHPTSHMRLPRNRVNVIFNKYSISVKMGIFRAQTMLVREIMVNFKIVA